MKKFDELKEDIAIEFGFKNFDYLKDDMLNDFEVFDHFLFKISKAYAEQAIDESIHQTEVCCNNFNPTITLKQLVNIKNDLQ